MYCTVRAATVTISRPSLPTPDAVDLHHGQPVCLRLESDPDSTSIARLKARCLLSLAPELASTSSSSLSLGPTASPVQHTSSLFPALCNGSGSGSEFALVELLSKVRLERTQGETPLEESVAPEASLAAAKVLTGTGRGRGTSLKLEWGMAPSSQQKMASLTGCSTLELLGI